jgi:serine/threonine protein kinase
MRVPDQEFYDIALKEYTLLEKISGHPNVIEVHDIYYNRIKEKIFMLMEYCGEGSNLHELIKKRKRESLEDNKIKTIMRCILEGI